MSIFVLTDVKFYMDGRDLSSDGNEIDVKPQVNLHDVTTWGQTTHIHRPGMYKGEWRYRGLQQFGVGLVDETLENRFPLSDLAILAAAEGGDSGERCYFWRSVSSQYKPLAEAKIDQPGMFEISGNLSGGTGMTPGNILEDGKTTRTTTGNGTAYQLGAIALGKSLYAHSHMLSINAGNVTITIESDDNGGFGTPTTRATFTAQTAIGGIFTTPVAGPITDDWWRAKWTAAGGATSFKPLVAMGIR
jgi:hypothetical protein